jgi:hypothetical protein
MKILSKGCYKGSREYNDDIIGHDKDLYYVLDGSTAVFNDNKFYKTSDLYEYMKLLNKNIKDSGSILGGIKTGIVNSNGKLKGLEKYKEYELPTFTVGAIKEYEQDIDVYVLCDILITILYKDGRIGHFVDKRINGIKQRHRDRVQEIKAMDISSDEKDKLLLEAEQETRKNANAKGGFPVGSTNPASIDEGYILMLPKMTIKKILICSDGMYNWRNPDAIDEKFFDKDYLEKFVEEALKEEKRDDLSYMLLEV